MKTIEHEGQEYVLKSDIESAYKSRIVKLSSRASEAEETAQALQAKIDSQVGKLDGMENLNSEIQALGERLQKSESKYTRHMALSSMGFQDEELREAVEWSYERSFRDQDEKPALADWMQTLKDDPSKAPSILRPHLIKPAPVITESMESIPKAKEESILIPPKTNTGATSSPVQNTDILKRGGSDFEFYKQNRESIKKAWKTRT
mgnify:CR=1 FL=1|tara:strand:- start:13777 stop:14391 length:615 start_codon:yes stop_codon:yes gene_type:complete